MLNQLFDTIIFDVSKWTFTVGTLLGLITILALVLLAWKLTKAVWRIRFYNRYEVAQSSRRKFESLLRQLILLVGGYGAIKLLSLDPVFYESENITLRFGLFIIVLMILVLAKLVDWVFTNILTHSLEKGRGGIGSNSKKSFISQEGTIAKATKTVRYILVAMAALLILKYLNLDISLYSSVFKDQVVDFRISKLLIVVLIILCARLIAWLLTNVALYNVYRQRDIDEGSQYAVNQLLKYVIYLIAIFVSLNSLGINMTFVMGGTAALLVGVGLGLQQTFNDFFSGLILLFERSVSVGDILTVDGLQGSVKKIGLRSSVVETLGNRTVIIPNSKLVNHNVVNWNHFDDKVRFDVKVGVAYGSDTELVKRLLIEAVEGHLDVLDFPKPFVRFEDFGDSDLKFSVFFFSDQLIGTDNIKSDIRFKIDKLFRDNDITIPFPQRDVWMK